MLEPRFSAQLPLSVDLMDMTWAFYPTIKSVVDQGDDDWVWRGCFFQVLLLWGKLGPVEGFFTSFLKVSIEAQYLVQSGFVRSWWTTVESQGVCISQLAPFAFLFSSVLCVGIKPVGSIEKGWGVVRSGGQFQFHAVSSRGFSLQSCHHPCCWHLGKDQPWCTRHSCKGC